MAGKRASFPDLLQGGASVGSLSEAIATPKDRLGELTHEPFASHVALCVFAQTLQRTSDALCAMKVAPVGQQRPASYASIVCARRALPSNHPTCHLGHAESHSCVLSRQSRSTRCTCVCECEVCENELM
jgi:hypothetical protein